MDDIFEFYEYLVYYINRSHSISQEVVSKFFVDRKHPINFHVNCSKLPHQFHVEFPVIEWIRENFHVDYYVELDYEIHLDIFIWVFIFLAWFEYV